MRRGFVEPQSVHGGEEVLEENRASLQVHTGEKKMFLDVCVCVRAVSIHGKACICVKNK